MPPCRNVFPSFRAPGLYALLDILLLVGIVVVFIFLLFVALPYALILAFLVFARYLLRGYTWRRGRWW